MTDTGSFASLTPTLLARKGGAKPAMRPQLQPLFHDSLARNVEDDLGWNDMGEDVEPHVATHTADVVPIQPEVAPAPRKAPRPAVVRQREEIETRVAPEPVVAPAQKPSRPAASLVVEAPTQPVIEAVVAAPAAALAPLAVPAPRRAPAAPQRQSAASQGKRAAFTLRVDGERHLKLRLACTIRNRSAQQLVTEALDRLLAELPDLGALAAQVAEKR